MYSKLAIETPIIVLVYFLLTVTHCSRVLMADKMLMADGIVFCLDLNVCISESDLRTLS